MDFSFNEEQLELREVARGFLADHSGSEQVRAGMASELGYDPQLWKQIGSELGWTSVAIPEEYGGLGFGTVELVALLEVMGESLVCSPFFASVGLAANAILVAGEEGQKQALLPGIAEGDTRATLAFSEARGGWSADSVSTTFEETDNGFLLEGTKRFVPDGHVADLLVVVARRKGTSGQEGIALFAVPATSPNLSRQRLPTMDSTSRQAEIQLDGVEVSSDARLGGESSSWEAVAQALDIAGICLAAEQTGGAQRCLDLAVEYAKEREQFGRPIGSFQAIKHKCADMMVQVESARSAVYYAACAAAQGNAELPVVASVAQATASDAFFGCAGDAIQIFGGVGFTWEYDIQLYFKRARSSAVLLGDATYHRELVAQRIGLGSPA
ncbi:MAG: acyl-CoA dehydrogenase family protein [Myxococcota bacterium]|nr:acyl-CoA dehydrogenase family protein [Myxococcota bacterium]